MRSIGIISLFLLLIIAQHTTAQQETEQIEIKTLPPIEMNRQTRGSIPETLLRPNRSEAPRYPIDTVIGELGRGDAPEGGYIFARSICEGLISGNKAHRALSSINTSFRENFLSSIEIINPLSYRIGGGREEADGAVSFLVRFIGKEQGITGELYLRLITEIIEIEIKEDATEEQETKRTYWKFDDLLLEEPRSKELEQQESIYLNDFNPYERFF